MKVFVGIIFGFLTLSAIAGAIYLGLKIRNQHEGLMVEHENLQNEISRLRTDLNSWEGTPENAAIIGTEFDSIIDTLSLVETNLEEIFTAKDGLVREPKLVLADAHEVASWRVYPFLLKIEGTPQAVDTFMLRLGENLPLLHLDRIESRWKASKMELELLGSVRFPLTD